MIGWNIAGWQSSFAEKKIAASRPEASLVKTFLHLLVVLHGGATFPPIEGVFLNRQQCNRFIGRTSCETCKNCPENSGHIRVLHGQATRKSYDVTVAMSRDTRRKSQDVVLNRVTAVCRKIRFSEKRPLLFDLRKGRCESAAPAVCCMYDEIATQRKMSNNVLSQD